MAVNKPLVATSQEPFGSEFPTTDAYPQKGYFKIDAPGAIETPCEMVSIATTETTAPKITRHQFAGVKDLPDDNLNQPF